MATSSLAEQGEGALHRTFGIPVPAPRWAALDNGAPTVARIAYQSAAEELIRAIREVMRSLGSMEQGHVGPLATAALDVPDRVTKRDYNYFNSLNAALAALPK